MQFSKLRLVGFKSFVDPTELIIADGLTGVVGPNGCGKSNLLEALRWVMGENRPTAMRGGGMEDVIFAGAATRPARNFAEVALTLDNRDRRAPPTFNSADALDVVRRITRDAGSAYKTNGKDTRARDVQMLFADASTGAHSPALVRQGQIAELINAKPKARRRVLEEAAGISGLYQRRHEAELKLSGAETNLTRVEDVIEQLEGQLATLARQAKQAARYRSILEDLRRAEGLVLYRRWREADQARVRATGALAEAVRLAAQGQTGASQAASLRRELEEKVPPRREEEAIAQAVLQRLMVERDTLADRESAARETVETLTRRIAQLAQDMTREEALAKDAGETINRLDWELVQIVKASEGQDDQIAASETKAQEAARVMQAKEADLDRQNEDAARLAARHSSAHRRLKEATDLAVTRDRAAAVAQEAVTKAELDLKAAGIRLTEADRAAKDAASAAEQAEAELAEADSARAKAQSSESEARATLGEADGEASALRAETAAVERVIARDRAEGGQLLDAVRAAKGYEAALGAALSDDLKAPVLAGDGASGWAVLDGYDAAPALPAGAQPLATQVRAPAALDRRLAFVGVVDRATGSALQAALQPGQRLVSVEGDLWRWDGYRAGAEDAPSSATLRLAQENRLDDLRSTLGEAEVRAASAKETYAATRAALDAAQTRDRAARAARQAADQAASEKSRARGRAEADQHMLAGRVETQRLSAAGLREDLHAARTAQEEAEAGVRDLGNLDAARARIETLKIAVEAARVTMLTKRSILDEARREASARTRRRQEITKEISGWRLRRGTAEERIADLGARRTASQADLETAAAAPGEIAEKRAALTGEVGNAQARVASASDALAVAETNLRQGVEGERAAERVAADAREARARAEALAEAAAAQTEAAAARIAEEMDSTPEVLLTRLNADPDTMPPAQVIEDDVLRLRRQRDALGAVNLRAEEDAREVAEEREALATEKTDLEAAIAKLRTGIAGLNKEGRDRLLVAFNTVNANFGMLFKHLFGGGDAELVLVESDDPLEAGLEIMCQPPGKKLSTLSLLSGGEQTLTALSLIFAVFLANPSPICVLDEVDAPLDDANVTRFCDLLDEMTKRTDTRFMIITHHAITMARMDRLFGVTMAELGVSQLVSVDLAQAERMAG